MKLIFSILIAQAAGVIGSIFTAPNIKNWYTYLSKPSWSPPNWLFAPVWTLLYTLMGIAAYLVWKKGKEPQVKKALRLYGINLIFNCLWSLIFFGLKNLGLAFLEIMILWVLIMAVMVRFYKIEKTAGLLLFPYFLWVSFASILNFAIWFLNVAK